MFKSFFPNPRWFFLSALGYAALVIFIWYFYNHQIGTALGFNILEADRKIVGLSYFVSESFQLFYLYYFFTTGVFATFWYLVSRHPWHRWSVVGSILIIFSTHFSVQVAVAINNWRKPFFDLVPKALSKAEGLPDGTIVGGNTAEEAAVFASQIYDLIITFAEIAFVAVAVFVMTRFFVSHFVFRWRTAMHGYYVSHWPQARHIEGASQRIQEDTMLFAEIVEDLGVSAVEALMKLFAFLPVLWMLSQYVKELPVVGPITYPLFIAAIAWATFGTAWLTAFGWNLPGLSAENQKVEHALRKELVYGEDDGDRAQPVTLKELFKNVRKNYFRLYWHYSYFNTARIVYLQADNIFVYVIMVPTIAVGLLTFGLLQQILTAFSEVGASFQYLVSSSGQIIKLLSVRKRLKGFQDQIVED